MAKAPSKERENRRVSDGDLREEALRRFSTDRLIGELRRRGFTISGTYSPGEDFDASIPKDIITHARAQEREPTVNPKHYKNTVEVTLEDGTKMEVPMQVVDVVEQFGLANKGHIMTAVIYLLRAGKKKIADEKDDWAKARWWITRAINFHGGHPEVPKGE